MNNLTKTKIILTQSFVAACLVSCMPNESNTVDQEMEPVEASHVTLLSVQEAQGLKGEWINAAYLESVEASKSIYTNRNKLPAVFGFTFEFKNDSNGTGMLKGYTEHEGGYSNALLFDEQEKHFVGVVGVSDKTPAFTSHFQLIRENDSMLKVYFPDSDKFERYRKVGGENQSLLKQILFEGSYLTEGNQTVQFDREGRVSGLKNYQYYTLIYDFVEGINFDAIVLFETKNSGNLPEGTVYKYEFSGDKLRLYQVSSNWNELQHSVGKSALVLRKTSGS